MKQIILTLLLTTCLSACALKSPCPNAATDKTASGNCTRCASGCACDQCECQKTGKCTCDKCENCPSCKGKSTTEPATGDAAKDAAAGAGAHKCPTKQGGVAK